MGSGALDEGALAAENTRLREENGRLQQTISQLEAKLAEPMDVVRALRAGEVEALVISQDGHGEEVFVLQRYESVYRQLVEEALPYGVWLAEADGRLIYVSRQFLEWVNTDLEELREKGQFHFLPEECRRTFEERWSACRKTGTQCTFEYSVRGIDGGERTILTRGILLQPHDGRRYWAGINLDVTEQKQIREDLRLKAEALEESDRRKDEFLALLGHELRNPIAVIKYGLHLIAATGQDEPRRREIMQAISNQVSHLNTIVDDLLDISRISRGAIALDLRRVELATAVRSVLESVRMSIAAKEHDLSLKLPEGPVYLMADPTRLEQILANLLNNAAKYTPSGGTIVLEARLEDRFVVIGIRDTGIGIAEEALPRIFDLFTQLETALDRTQGGLGIGLTVVRKLVELHGGTVHAHSEGLGKGSEFVVRLPVLAGDEASDSEPLSAPAGDDARGGPLRVLLAEDSEDLAHFTEIALSSWGHEVTIARDGPSALAAYLEARPDVAVLDIGLPGMDGYELARRIREAQPPQDPPVLVAMTGYGREQDRLRAEAASFDHHLVKPADVEHLQEILAAAASRRGG